MDALYAFTALAIFAGAFTAFVTAAVPIFAARRSALLFVRGAIVGGAATLTRGLGFVGASPFAALACLFTSVEPLRGLDPKELLGREVVLVARTDAADAGRENVGRLLPGRSSEAREEERETVLVPARTFHHTSELVSNLSNEYVSLLTHD